MADKGPGRIPAGWYKRPTDPNQERYWDGEGWTNSVRPTYYQRDPIPILPLPTETKQEIVPASHEVIKTPSPVRDPENQEWKWWWTIMPGLKTKKDRQRAALRIVGFVVVAFIAWSRRGVETALILIAAGLALNVILTAIVAWRRKPLIAYGAIYSDFSLLVISDREELKGQLSIMEDSLVWMLRGSKAQKAQDKIEIKLEDVESITVLGVSRPARGGSRKAVITVKTKTGEEVRFKMRAGPYLVKTMDGFNLKGSCLVHFENWGRFVGHASSPDALQASKNPRRDKIIRVLVLTLFALGLVFRLSIIGEDAGIYGSSLPSCEAAEISTSAGKEGICSESFTLFGILPEHINNVVDEAKTLHMPSYDAKLIGEKVSSPTELVTPSERVAIYEIVFHVQITNRTSQPLNFNVGGEDTALFLPERDEFSEARGLTGGPIPISEVRGPIPAHQSATDQITFTIPTSMINSLHAYHSDLIFFRPGKNRGDYEGKIRLWK